MTRIQKGLAVGKQSGIGGDHLRQPIKKEKISRPKTGANRDVRDYTKFRKKRGKVGGARSRGDIPKRERPPENTSSSCRNKKRTWREKGQGGRKRKTQIN